MPTPSRIRPNFHGLPVADLTGPHSRWKESTHSDKKIDQCKTWLETYVQRERLEATQSKICGPVLGRVAPALTNIGHH